MHFMYIVQTYINTQNTTDLFRLLDITKRPPYCFLSFVEAYGSKGGLCLTTKSTRGWNEKPGFIVDRVKASWISSGNHQCNIAIM